jgi:hypothetical protein
MFSKELENLIQATLEDGVLEDYEKAALVKRAQAEGVDLTELEIYINSILQKRQKELDIERNAQIQKKAQEKKEAFGQVCPNCGKQVPPMTLKCECGYEFTKAKAISSVQELVDKIDMINMDYTSVAEREKKICDAIELFPVPNTKEDILEFMSLAVSNIKKSVGTSNIVTMVLSFLAKFYTFGLAKTNPMESDAILQSRRKKSWRSKFDQILLKGRSLRGDADFQKQLDYYESMVNKK